MTQQSYYSETDGVRYDHCPHCGQRNAHSNVHCWDCGEAMGEVDE
jgi:hypothetical protein